MISYIKTLKNVKVMTILITGKKAQKSDHMFMDPILTVDFSHHSHFL